MPSHPSTNPSYTISKAVQENTPLVTQASLSKLGQKDRAASGALWPNGSLEDDSAGQVGGLQQGQVCPPCVQAACSGFSMSHICCSRD